MLEKFHCKLFPPHHLSLETPVPGFSARLCLCAVYICPLHFSGLCASCSDSFLELSFSILSLHLIFHPSHALCLYLLIPFLVSLFLPFFSFAHDHRTLIHFAFIFIYFFSPLLPNPDSSSPAWKKRIWTELSFPLSPFLSGQAAQITATVENSVPEMKLYVAICVILYRSGLEWEALLWWSRLDHVFLRCLQNNKDFLEMNGRFKRNCPQNNSLNIFFSLNTALPLSPSLTLYHPAHILHMYF